MNENIATQLFDVAARVPTRTAVRHLPSGHCTTYGELARRVRGIATSLRKLGLAPGDRIALLLNNSPAYLEAFFGALTAGLVVVPLNTRLSAPDFAHMIADSGSRVLLSEKAFRSVLNDPRLPVAHVVEVDERGPVPSLEGFADKPPSDPVHRAGTDLCSLMYTSGTTGSPKAVMLSHGSWTSVADTMPTLLSHPDGLRVLHAAPLTHGAGFLMLPTIRSAGVNVTCGSFSPTETARLIASGDVDGLFLVPSMIQMLLDVLPDQWAPADNFRWLYYAGSPIGVETLREASARLDCRLVQSFAQMEAPMFLTSLGMNGHREALTDSMSDAGRTAGSVIEGRDVEIVDEKGTPVSDGSVGEIIARAPQTMLGYWNRDEDTKRAIRDGWLYTGDLGRIDAVGRLHVVDRKKDMIVSGGSNIYAREVEEALEGAPGVTDCAVIGLPHRTWGEQVTAVVVPATDHVIDADVVRNYCRDRLAGYKVPKLVISVPELPRNPYGKVLKKDLRRLLAPESLDAARP